MCNLKAPFFEDLNEAVFWLYQYSAFPLNSHHLSKTEFHFKTKQTALCILKSPLSRNKPYISWDLNLFMYLFTKCKAKTFHRNHQVHWPYSMLQIGRCSPIYLVLPQISLVATEINCILISTIYRGKDFFCPRCGNCQHKSRQSVPPFSTTIFTAESQA